MENSVRTGLGAGWLLDPLRSHSAYAEHDDKLTVFEMSLTQLSSTRPRSRVTQTSGHTRIRNHEEASLNCDCDVISAGPVLFEVTATAALERCFKTSDDFTTSGYR